LLVGRAAEVASPRGQKSLKQSSIDLTPPYLDQDQWGRFLRYDPAPALTSINEPTLLRNECGNRRLAWSRPADVGRFACHRHALQAARRCSRP